MHAVILHPDPPTCEALLQAIKNHPKIDTRKIDIGKTECSQQALTWIQTQPKPALLVMPASFGDFDGLALSQEIRDLNCTYATAILLLFPTQDANNRERTRHCRADQYLEGQVTPEEVSMLAFDFLNQEYHLA